MYVQVITISMTYEALNLNYISLLQVFPAHISISMFRIQVPGIYRFSPNKLRLDRKTSAFSSQMQTTHKTFLFKHAPLKCKLRHSFTSMHQIIHFLNSLLKHAGSNSFAICPILHVCLLCCVKYYVGYAMSYKILF